MIKDETVNMNSLPPKESQPLLEKSHTIYDTGLISVPIIKKQRSFKKIFKRFELTFIFGSLLIASSLFSMFIYYAGPFLGDLGWTLAWFLMLSIPVAVILAICTILVFISELTNKPKS